MDPRVARPKVLRFPSPKHALRVADSNLTTEKLNNVARDVLATKVHKTLAWVQDASEILEKKEVPVADKKNKLVNANLYNIRDIPVYKLPSVVDKQPHTGTPNLAQPIRAQSMHARCMMESSVMPPLSAYAKKKLKFPKQASRSMACLPCVPE